MYINFTKYLNKKNRGFTAIELLIVIAIMGILIAIVLGSFDRSGERARDSARIAGMQNVILALEEYHSVCGSYPMVLDIDGVGNNSLCFSSTGVTPVMGDFIAELPQLPDGAQYKYATYPMNSGSGSSICSEYHIGVSLEQTDPVSDLLGEDSDVMQPFSQYSWYPNSVCGGLNGSDPDFSGDDSDLPADDRDLMYDLISFPIERVQ